MPVKKTRPSRSTTERREPHPAELLDAIGRAVIATDADGHFTYMNRAAELLYGWKFGDVEGLNAADILSAETMLDRARQIAEAVRSGESWKGEFPVRRRDGTEFSALVTCNPLYGEAGAVVGMVGVFDDITAQKRAVQRLELEKDHLQDVFEHAPAFMAVLRGPDHVFEMANAAFYEHSGLEDILGERLVDTLPGFEAQGYLAILDNVYETGKPYIGREMSVDFSSPGDAETAIRHVDFVYQPLKTEDGVTTGVLMHGVDITEQIQARELVRKTSRSHDTILDHSVDVICIFDRKGRFSRVSAACERIWGYTPAELAGRKYSEFLLPDDVERTWRSVLGGAELNHFENRTIRKDGDIVLMSWTSTWYEEDELFYAVGRDVTLEREKEAALASQDRELRKSEARYRAIVDTANEGVWLVDEESRTTFVNERMADMLGYSQDEMVGRMLFDFIVESDQSQMHERFRQRRYGVSDSYDVRLRHADGSIRWAHISASPFYSENGAFSGALGMVADITERKRAEDALVEAKEKAEEMARLKSSFLTNMSHEIRTPIASIIGVADILSEEVSGESRSLVDILRIGGQRLLLTLDSVLALAQLESKSIQLNPVSLDLVEQARDVISMFDGQATEKNLFLKLDSSVETVSALADKGAVSRILTNLINNGLKFTLTGGVTVGVGAEAGYVWLQVSDTGIGIGEEFLSRIFEDFQQESSGAGRAYEGVGLGLAITKRLVDMMGGNICLRTRKGEGTTFTVCIPTNEEHTSTVDSNGSMNGVCALHGLSGDRGPAGRLICPGENCRVRNRGMLVPRATSD